MRETTIDAIKVEDGQTVTRIVANGLSRWRKRPTEINQDIRRINGSWPTVTKTNFQKRGEDNEPTVYLYLSDSPDRVFPLRPDDQVTVEVA